jgi:NAD-dependent SIR2 family protein deacetylase
VNVLELHGTIFEVECLNPSCRATYSRGEVQRVMEQDNKEWVQTFLGPNADAVLGTQSNGQTAVRPDGDVELPPTVYDAFVAPVCPSCGRQHGSGASDSAPAASPQPPQASPSDAAARPPLIADLPPGVLKPRVVFHGGWVPEEVKQRARTLVDRSDAVLVVGSTLTVYSSFGLARAAAQAGKPVLVLNKGETRIDPFATVKLEAEVSEFLPLLVDAVADHERKTTARADTAFYAAAYQVNAEDDQDIDTNESAGLDDVNSSSQ